MGRCGANKSIFAISPSTNRGKAISVPNMGRCAIARLGEVFDWIMLNAAFRHRRDGFAKLSSRLICWVDSKARPSFVAALRRLSAAGAPSYTNASQLSLIPEEFRAIAIDGYIDDSEDIHDEITGRDYVMSSYQGPVLKDNVKGAYRLALTQARQPVRKIFRDKANRPVVLWSKAANGGIFWVLGETHGHNFLPDSQRPAETDRRP